MPIPTTIKHLKEQVVWACSQDFVRLNQPEQIITYQFVEIPNGPNQDIFSSIGLCIEEIVYDLDMKKVYYAALHKNLKDLDTVLRRTDLDWCKVFLPKIVPYLSTIRPLTEKEAWTYLGQLWRKATRDTINSLTMVRIEDIPCLGICACIDEMYRHIMITNSMRNIMREKLDNYREDKGIRTVFFWGSSPEGARERSKFCVNQTSKL